MAYTKTHPIKSTLKLAIAYICNPAKTDGKLLVSSFGCTPETADIEFEWTRKHSVDMGTHLGRHLIQSFAPDEVSPEQAHEIGKALADEVLKGKYEYVLTTHVDGHCIHNHLIFNSVSFTDYTHYHSNKRSYWEIRNTSDRLCREHGLSVIEPDGQKQEIQPSGNRVQIRKDIDRLLPGCRELSDLLERLQQEGYQVKYGKHIAVKGPDNDRYARLKSLGPDYTEAALKDRIAGKPRPSMTIDIQLRELYDVGSKESPGLQHWATVQNLKLSAKTMLYLKEHSVDSYEDLMHRMTAESDKRDTLLDEIKSVEGELARVSMVIKYTEVCSAHQAVYTQYTRAKDKELFLRGHESEIVLYESARRELKRLDAYPPEDISQLRQTQAELAAQKKELYREYSSVKKELREFETVKRNIDTLLREPAEPKKEIVR